MTNENSRSWQFNRQINISVIVQLIFLAALIVGSWVNLQRQLDLMQRDVTYLCQCQKELAQKLESLSAKSIAYEYRLRALERSVLDAGCPPEGVKGVNGSSRIEKQITNNK